MCTCEYVCACALCVIHARWPSVYLQIISITEMRRDKRHILLCVCEYFPIAFCAGTGAGLVALCGHQWHLHRHRPCTHQHTDYTYRFRESTFRSFHLLTLVRSDLASKVPRSARSLKHSSTTFRHTLTILPR